MGWLKNIFNIKSTVKEEKLNKKIVIAFFFMSLVPILLTLYIIFFVLSGIKEDTMSYLRLIMLWMVLISLAGFGLVKTIVRSINKVVKDAQAVAKGDLTRKIETGENNEVNELAKAFNRITSELQAKIEELEVSKKIVHNIFQKIGDAVVSSRGIDNLLELIIQSIAVALDAASGRIMFLDEKKEELYVKVSFNEELKPEDAPHIALGEGLLGLAVKEGKPYLVRNPSRKGEEKEGYESILCVPLIYKNEKLGVIAVNNKHAREGFSEDDLQILTNIANQAAVAIKNAQLNEDIEKTYFETITALAIAVEAKDPYSRGHSDRVSQYVMKLGERMNLDDSMMKLLRDGAVLHDLGKIGIKDEILLKKTFLTPEEKKIMDDHVIIGENIMKPVRSLSALCDLVRHHQERYDGKGYPDNLKGEEISLAARILKVADAFDAMTTDRPYRKAMSFEEAKQELKRHSGTEFDGKIVDVFVEAI